MVLMERKGEEKKKEETERKKSVRCEGFYFDSSGLYCLVLMTRDAQ